MRPPGHSFWKGLLFTCTLCHCTQGGRHISYSWTQQSAEMRDIESGPQPGAGHGSGYFLGHTLLVPLCSASLGNETNREEGSLVLESRSGSLLKLECKDDSCLNCKGGCPAALHFCLLRGMLLVVSLSILFCKSRITKAGRKGWLETFLQPSWAYVRIKPYKSYKNWWTWWYF